jgi:hypothetical protein
MYVENPSGITQRVRKVLAKAGFKDVERQEDKTNNEKGRVELHAQRKTGLRRASVRDFHSFRVTWVTLALTARVPLELVQKVTGHRTTEIVLKHYFQPGREEFRQALQEAMPKLLNNGTPTPRERMIRILERMTAKSWQKDAERLRQLVEEV